jgi:hypothetical protein
MEDFGLVSTNVKNEETVTDEEDVDEIPIDD